MKTQLGGPRVALQGRGAEATEPHDGAATFEAVNAPPTRRGDVAFGFVGFAERAGRAVHRVDPCRPRVAIIVAAHDIVLRTTGGSQTAHKAFVAGAACAPVHASHDGVLTCVEIDSPPWACGSVLGAALSCDKPVALADVIGSEANELVERLEGSADWARRFALVERFLNRRLSDATRAVSPEVRWAWERLERSGGRASVGALASDVGWSGRHFGRRFLAETGVLPKVAARRLRFDRARSLVESTPHPLAEVAAACGYADQSHMTREFAQLARCSPAIYRTARFPNLPGTPAEALGI